MPLRGESIGTAYVRVLADATGFPDSLREEINRDEPGIKREGRHTAQAFREGFDDEMERAGDQNLSAVLNRALGSNQATQEFFQGSDWKKFKTRMGNEFGNVGELAAHELEEKFVNSGSLKGLDDDVENVIRRISATTKRISDVQGSEAAAAQKRMTDFENEFRRVMNETDALSKKVSSDNVDNLERTRRTFENLRSSVGRFSDEFFKSGNRIDSMFKKLRDGEKDTRTASTTFGRLAQAIDHIADGTGRAFGKGSRNDFLNFTGSFIANSLKILSIGPKIADNIGQFGIGFSDALKQGEGFFSSIRTGFSTMALDANGAGTALSGAFSSILLTLPVLVAALGGIVVILGVVSSLISGLAGAVIALAGTLSFGLVGALAPLAGLLAPLALGIGGVVLAVATLTKKTRAELLKPFVDQLKDLGKTAREGFSQTFTGNIDKIAGSLRVLNPLVEAIGEAFGTIADNISKSIGGHPFQHFLDVMERVVPGMLIQISKIAGNVATALGLIFIDTVPDAQSFLGWLKKITGEFDAFLKQNPKQVRSFLDDAAGSAKQIGDFLGAAVRLLGTLLSSGKDSGDTILGNLTDNLNQFNQFLKDNPKALDDFFSNAETVANELGDIAISLGQIFDALDDPSSRKSLEDVLGLLSDIGKVAGPLATLSDLAFNAGNSIITLILAFQAVKGPASAVIGFIDQIAQAVGRLTNMKLPNLNLGAKIKAAFGNLGDLFKGPGGGSILAIKPPSLAWIGGVNNKIAAFVQGVINAGKRITFAAFGTEARNAANAVGRAFSVIPGRLSGLATKIGIAAAFWGTVILANVSQIPGRIIDFFAGLGGRIANAIGSISLHFNFPDPPSWLGKLGSGLSDFKQRVTASGGVFNGAAARIIGEAGPEAVVPLNRPLSQVDPSVRWLSAIAQGLTPIGTDQNTAPGKVINNEFTIMTPTTDPAAVAREVVNQMVATGY